MDAGLNIVEKIHLCGNRLQEWGGNMNREFQVKMHMCREALRKLRLRRDVQGIQQYNVTRWEYLKLLDQKEIYWK